METEEVVVMINNLERRVLTPIYREELPPNNSRADWRQSSVEPAHATYISLEEAESAIIDLSEKLIHPENEIDQIQLFEMRRALYFLVGSMDKAFEDDLAVQFLKNKDHEYLLQYRSDYYTTEKYKQDLALMGLGHIVLGEVAKGTDLLNKAAASGDSTALLLLRAMNLPTPTPFECKPDLLWGEERTENEQFFIGLKELLQQQKFEEVIQQVDQFLGDMNRWSSNQVTRNYEHRFVHRIRGCGHALLGDTAKALQDYNQSIALRADSDALIERSLIHILAGHQNMAKMDLQKVATTRYNFPNGSSLEERVSWFAFYDFDAMKLRALMIEKWIDRKNLWI